MYRVAGRDRLLHRLSTVDSALKGALISTHHTELHVLAAPVEGADWLAADGPSNDQDNHHRRGVVILDGRPVDSRRYAIDWKQIRDGASFSGDSAEINSQPTNQPTKCNVLHDLRGAVTAEVAS